MSFCRMKKFNMIVSVDSRPTVSIIIPVHNGGDKFRQSIAGVMQCLPEPMEVIVVTDGDTDGSWRMAEEFGARVVRVSGPGGPARARNIGALASKGDILFFVDADVVISQEAVGRVVGVFESTADLAAVFGSYDDEPMETNFLSQYKNLLHHYVHQTSKAEASTFWGACGAIRREIFFASGGFNEGYNRPAIEDVELGYRLKRAGHRIRLMKRLKIKHLKRWSVFSLLESDFFYRALPWADLIQRDGRFVNDLNLKTSSRVSVALAHLLPMTILGALFAPWLAVLSAVIMIGLFGLNRDLYRFFRKKRGVVFMAKAIPWHWFYFYYSGVAFAFEFIKHRLERSGILRRKKSKVWKRFVTEGIYTNVDNEQ